jgi:MFS family permease
VDTLNKKSPFAIKNIRLFIFFRLFFNARFYYPVFTILFLDFGLTLEQFALLNVAWAASIVLLEVPSGALADTLGRKNLLVVTGVLMVLEMAILCFVPMGNPDLLFALFLINRVLSGAAEAAASGADEAIAYDSLKMEGNIADWGRVYEKQMRVKSVGFIIAMSLGAAVYDPALMQRLANALGININLTQDITLRFPVYLTFIMALMTLLTTIQMRELAVEKDIECSMDESCRKSVIQAFRVTLRAGAWILKTPFALIIILAGLVFDNCIRMIMTLTSQYYRLIALPEASFGLIGSGLAVLGLFIPGIALKMVARYSPVFNMGVMAFITLLGLIGLTFFLPVFGLIPILMLVSVMYLLTFFQSHYLNRITSSEQRATVLSFKGLSLNLAYGIIGILYAFLLTVLRFHVADTQPHIGGGNLKNLVFTQSINWFPLYFFITLVVLLLFARGQLRNSNEHVRLK